MDFKTFLTAKYLFQINRVMVETGDKAFFVAGLVFFIFAVIFKLAALYSLNPVDKQYRQKFFSLFLSIGIAEMVWYAARIQTIAFFGTHFVSWLIILIGFIWFTWIIVKMIKNYRKEKKEWDKEQVKLKYLPK